MAKYNTYRSDNKTIVVSRYAGKSVRGVAKCDPADVFDESYGERLAKARCDLKVSEKRYCRAADLANEAAKELVAAQNRLNKMLEYLRDANNELDAARNLVSEVEAEANRAG